MVRIFKQEGAIVDIIEKSRGYSIHKQIERKNGMLFMRIKKRKHDIAS